MSTRNQFQIPGVAARTAFVLAISVVGCRGSVSELPPVHLNPNMDNVTRIEAQEPSDFWSDGRGMRPPVVNTIAQGELREDDHLYRGKKDGAFAASLPPQVPLSEETLQRGHARYEIYCQPCHGLTGAENGGVVPQRGIAEWQWAVPSLHGERQRGYPVGRIYDIISNGFNTMPSYSAQIPVNDRWAIAAYVRALQVAYEVPLSDVPRSVASQRGWR